MTTPKRAGGRLPSLPRRLALRELQHHARNARFTPGQAPGMSPQQIASATGLELKLARVTLHNMHAAGQVVNAGTHNKPLWRLTTADDLVRDAQGPMHQHAGTYDGAELRPYTGRPGAMDAYALPSLANGVRVPAKRPEAQCVGALADRRNPGRPAR